MNARVVHLVDDEEPVRRSLHLLLRVMGFAPRGYGSGVEFLNSLADVPLGCVLLDLRMPEIDGLEVQRHLTAAGAPHPVVMMSGHGDLGVALTAMEQGAIAFLEKPFSRAKLAEVLGIAFSRVESEPKYREYLQSSIAAMQRLSPSDREVLELLVRGDDLEAIGKQTSFTADALELARSRIFTELGAGTLPDVLRVVFAARRAVS